MWPNLNSRQRTLSFFTTMKQQRWQAITSKQRVHFSPEGLPANAVNRWICFYLINTTTKAIDDLFEYIGKVSDGKVTDWLTDWLVSHWWLHESNPFAFVTIDRDCHGRSLGDRTGNDFMTPAMAVADTVTSPAIRRSSCCSVAKVVSKWPPGLCRLPRSEYRSCDRGIGDGTEGRPGVVCRHWNDSTLHCMNIRGNYERLKVNSLVYWLV
jgi:hypothetical protein